MPRRKSGIFNDVASLPWPAGIIAGLLVFLAVRYGVPWVLGQSGRTIGQAFADDRLGESLSWLAWALLLVCWLAAAASYFGRIQRTRLYDAQAASPRLTALSWRQFELLVGEWFRRQGYVVEETGGGGSDGGVDLVVRKDGRRELVQCKHWKRRNVDVATAREMWGLLQHHNADGVWIVCGGRFTADAASFATGKPIRLVAGRDLESALVRTLPDTPSEPEGRKEPVEGIDTRCRRCGSSMTRRQNRKTGEAFLGCPAFPRCRETVHLAKGPGPE